MFSLSKSVVRAGLGRYVSTPPPISSEKPNKVTIKSSERKRKDALKSITRIDNFIPITRKDLSTALVNKQNFMSQNEQKLLNQLIGGMQHSVIQKMNSTHEKMKEM